MNLVAHYSAKWRLLFMYATELDVALAKCQRATKNKYEFET